MSHANEPITFQSKVTSDLIAEYLRDRILDGTFAPSTNINEVQLATTLNISRGPVREAVQRLVQEGLLVSARNRGTFVVDLGPEDVADLYKARNAIEREAGRLVIRTDRRQLVSQLTQVLDEMSSAIKDNRWRDIAGSDLKFHETIVAATRSTRLEKMFSTLAAETLLCVRQFQHVYERQETLLEQHQRLLDLLQAGDEDAYLAEIDWHLNHVTNPQKLAQHHLQPTLPK